MYWKHQRIVVFSKVTKTAEQYMDCKVDLDGGNSWSF